MRDGGWRVERGAAAPWRIEHARALSRSASPPPLILSPCHGQLAQDDVRLGRVPARP